MGRNNKPIELVLTELQEDIRELSYDVLALHKKLDRVKARWLYWLKKQKVEEYRRRMRKK